MYGEQKIYQCAGCGGRAWSLASYAYKLIRELNTERAADGFVTIKGRVSRQYFDERIYGTTDKKEVV